MTLPYEPESNDPDATRPSATDPQLPADPNAETQPQTDSSTEKTGPVRLTPADPNAQTQAYTPPAGWPDETLPGDATQVNLPGDGWNSDMTRPSLPYTYPDPYFYPPPNTQPDATQAYPQDPYPQGSYPQGPYPQDPYLQGQYPPGQYPQGSYSQGPYPQGPGSQNAYGGQPSPYQQPYPQPVVEPQKPARRGRQEAPRRPRRRVGCGCGCLPVLLAGLLIILAYFLAPLRTHILVLGADRAPEGTMLSRTDTMILVSVNPLLPDIKMLSIPRDLWISIPGVGENRINTVHFFAENNQPGSGPATTAQVVAQTFGVRTPYYARLRFDGVVGIVDAMGGVDVNLPEAMSGYEAGWNHLTGDQALAFSRDRAGADDFFRMAHGQILIKAVIQQALKPTTWLRLPQMIQAGLAMVDTNIPAWQWPRLGLALARGVLMGGLDSRTFDRSMATPYVTADGAQVLMPQWDLIRPVIREMFGGG